MQVESIIKSEGVSKIDLDGVTYHFKQDAEGRHVAEVASRKHLSRLLAIPEGYKLLDDDDEDVPASSGAGGESVRTDNPDEADADASDAATGQTLKAIPVPITEDMGRDTLAFLWEQRFGKKPHHAKNAKTLADELNGAA